MRPLKLILANLRVSVSIASEYLHTGADHMDLIQEGNVGLLQAIKNSTPRRTSALCSLHSGGARAYILRYPKRNTYRLTCVGTTQDQRKLFLQSEKGKAKLEREGFASDSKSLADRLGRAKGTRCHRNGSIRRQLGTVARPAHRPGKRWNARGYPAGA
ncbi:MAG: hypothetical protein IPO99_10180 [Nitrospira sp.]|nr:hypothetical protein [Nitrospira sp.]